MHTPLERFVGAFKLFRRFYARRDVGEGRDDSAVRHGIRAYLDDEITIGETLQERLAVRSVPHEPFAHERIGDAAIRGSAFGMQTQDVIEAGAHARELRRQSENLSKLPVPAHKTQVLVENRDPLPHMIKRRLQNLAVVVDGCVGIIEQFQRRFGRDGTFTQQERQYEPRRGGADRRGE